MAVPGAIISVINISTLVSDQQVKQMTAGMYNLLTKFCRDWGQKQYFANVLPKEKSFGFLGIKLYVQDEENEEIFNKYHDSSVDTTYNIIYIKPILDNGGAVFLGKDDPTVPTVAQILSHELFALIYDMNCNLWWQTDDKYTLCAAEVCDPVHCNLVKVSVGADIIGYSDWVLPSWTEAGRKHGPFNHLNTLSAPFSIDDKGFVTTISAVNVKNVFGEAVPEWLKTARLENNRVTNRQFVGVKEW